MTLLLFAKWTLINNARSMIDALYEISRRISTVANAPIFSNEFSNILLNLFALQMTQYQQQESLCDTAHRQVSTIFHIPFGWAL